MIVTRWNARAGGMNEIYRLALAGRGFPFTPETHRIVFTGPDGRVGVTAPTHEALYFMTGPGGYWNGYHFGFLAELVRRKTCPILQKGHPCTKESATRFVKAMQWGGRSCEEAWDIIAQHDCARWGTAVEIVHVDDLPLEHDQPNPRRYRDAWRRSPNGGAIYVDERIAHQIDEQRNAA